VRGFAVVHCLGILTSMFSAVFFSRGVVNLWYGRKKRRSPSASLEAGRRTSGKAWPSAAPSSRPHKSARQFQPDAQPAARPAPKG
jgi:preprotein translocase subunit SecD